MSIRVRLQEGGVPGGKAPMGGFKPPKTTGPAPGAPAKRAGFKPEPSPGPVAGNKPERVGAKLVAPKGGHAKLKGQKGLASKGQQTAPAQPHIK